MPNQMMPMTDGQRLALLLQSNDQNAVMPQQQMPSQAMPSNPFAPATSFMMNRLMNKQATPGTPQTPGVPGVPNLPLGGGVLMPNQVVSLNTAVSPYQADLAQIAQRQKLAEMLQQQSSQPEQTFSYNGIQAPIPATAGLNKVLSGLLSGYMAKKNIQDQRDLSTKAQSDASDWITKLTSGTAAKAEVPGSVVATPADVEDRDQGIQMGSGASPMTSGQPIPVPGGQGEGANVGSPATQAMTPQARMALLLQGIQNPLTSQAAGSMLANEQGLSRQQALQQAQFEQQKQLQEGQFGQQSQMQSGQQAFQQQMEKQKEAFALQTGTPIMVPDPTSSTGFKYVRPEQAVGQPAYNPNAMFAPMGAPGGQPPGTQGALTGDDYLKTLSPQAADTVKGLAEGRIPVSPMMVRTPQGMQMLAAASQYDPTFDASNYAARAAQRKNYEGGGKQFQELQAISTVAGHLQDLSKTADALKNSSFPWWNSVANTASQAGGNPAVDQFNTVKQAVTNELSKAYRGGAVTEGDVSQWQQNLSSSKSPEQLKAVVGQLNDLLASKRQALEDGFKGTMGKTQPPSEFSATNARTKAIFDKVGQWAQGMSSPSEAQPTAQPSTSPDIDALLKKYQ